VECASTKLKLGVKVGFVYSLCSIDTKLVVTLSFAKNAGKSKTELIDEITRLEKEVRAKNEEIATLRKKLSLYKSL
jgi:hypothetical protein